MRARETLWPRKSALRTAVVVVVFIVGFPPETGPRTLPALSGAYARTAPSVLWTMTSPSVTFGGFLRILSSETGPTERTLFALAQLPHMP